MDSRFVVKVKPGIKPAEAPSSPTYYRWHYPSKALVKDLEEHGVDLDSIIQRIGNEGPLYKEERVNDGYAIVTVIEPRMNGVWRVAIGEGSDRNCVDVWYLDFLIKKVA